MNNTEIVRSLYEAFGEGDVETAFGLMAPDIEWREAENQPSAEGNPYVGPKEIGEGVFGLFMAAFEGFQVAPETFVAEGDHVVALGRYTGTHRASDTPLDAAFAHVWTVRDGTLVAFQQHTDTAQMSRLMG